MVSPDLLERVLDEEMKRLTSELGEDRVHAGRFAEARALFWKLATNEQLADFLTTLAYDALDDAAPITLTLAETMP
jgi:malate synthase